MTNRKRFRSQQPFQDLLKGLKRNGALEPVQVESVERIERLAVEFFHALEVSKGNDAKLVFGQIAKELCKVFLKDRLD
jgi:hypothetical protein